jgi:coiled-coil domain-containing protein 151
MPGGEKQYVVMEQQIEDLRERMRLLQQDRRANVDLLESNKSSNQEEIRYSREENKDLRVRLSQLQRAGDESQGENQELVHAQKEVLRMRAEYDSLKR